MKHYITSLTLLALGSLSAQAGLITSAPAGAATTVFALGSTSCGGTVDAGFTLSGSYCANFSGNYNLGTNGSWNGFAMIGGGGLNGGFLINLGGLYSFVGGFFNYLAPAYSGCIDGGGCSKDPTIVALAADGVTVLGTYDLSVVAPINTPGGLNAGAFAGIQDASNNIAYLDVLGGDLSIHSITLGTSGSAAAAPEPSTVLLFGCGLGLLLSASRHRFVRSILRRRA